MTTKLEGPLKRDLRIGRADYTLTITPQGLSLALKGKRKGFDLEWSSLISGDAAVAAALNASLTAKNVAPAPAAPPKRKSASRGKRETDKALTAAGRNRDSGE